MKSSIYSSIYTKIPTKLKITILTMVTISTCFGASCNSVNFSKYVAHKGHTLAISKNQMSYESANALALSSGGYLAIPNDSLENDLYTSLNWNGWIGIRDNELIPNYCLSTDNCIADDKRFTTVKNEKLLYKNWATNEPINTIYTQDITSAISPLGENWVYMYGGKWYSEGNHYNSTPNYYAIVEWDSELDCVSSTPADPNNLPQDRWCFNGTYFDRCGKDSQNTEYCPIALADCGSEWDYDSGVAVSHTMTRATSETCLAGTTPDSTASRCMGGNACASVGGSYDSATDKCVSTTTVTSGGVETISATANQYSCNQYSNVSMGYCSSGADGCYRSGKTWQILQLNTSSSFINSDIRNKYGSNKEICVVLLAHAFADSYCETSSAEGSCVNVFGYAQPYSCPSGYTLSGSQCTKNTTTTTTQTVYNTPSCPGATPYRDGGTCYALPQSYIYYEYMCKNETNFYSENWQGPISSGSDCSGIGLSSYECNSATPPVNNCKREKFVCKSDSNKACAKIDTKWKCSPFVCQNANDVTTNLDTSETTLINNGTIDEKGNCSGSFYIFSGKDNRCRSIDYFGGIGIDGGCCNKDKVLFGLISCETKEIGLSKLRDSNQCHYVGDYCATEFFGICVKTKQSYCCFNSKLARIFNEQGRPQINKGWGTPTAPKCEGYRPEEFQKLDFTKMDLSEFYKELNTKINTSVVNNINSTIVNKIQNYYK